MLRVDIVITDHAMPTMTGLQLAEIIQERYPGLPIILATGFAELPADPAKFRIPKLSKPCTQHEMAVAIQTALNPDYQHAPAHESRYDGPEGGSPALSMSALRHR